MALTLRRRQIYEFIRHFIEQNRYGPTIDEIGRYFKLRSASTIHKHLVALEGAGLIERIPNAARGITLVNQDEPGGEAEVPLLGVVAAGRPIEADLNYETVSVPRDMLGRGRVFALRVRGDSMIEEHIRDGDLIIVLARQSAENGQTVIALVDGRETTVKKFYQERGRVRLEAANPQFQPILVKPPQRVQIQGVVVGVIRRYPLGSERRPRA